MTDIQSRVELGGFEISLFEWPSLKMICKNKVWWALKTLECCTFGETIQRKDILSELHVLTLCHQELRGRKKKSLI